MSATEPERPDGRAASVIAEGQNGAPDDCSNSGSLTSLGYNLVETVGTCTFGATGDVTGRDPKLGPLQDNGGGTWTHALSAGSPAIDAGDPAFFPPPAIRVRPARPRFSACDKRTD